MRYKLFIITFVDYVFIFNNDDKLQTCHHHLVLEFFSPITTNDNKDKSYSLLLQVA
jgi:hypothetical protein